MREHNDSRVFVLDHQHQVYTVIHVSLLFVCHTDGPVQHRWLCACVAVRRVHEGLPGGWRVAVNAATYTVHIFPINFIVEIFPIPIHKRPGSLKGHAAVNAATHTLR